jgi:hypothetical protein
MSTNAWCLERGWCFASSLRPFMCNVDTGVLVVWACLQILTASIGSSSFSAPPPPPPVPVHPCHISDRSTVMLTHLLVLSGCNPGHQTEQSQSSKRHRQHTRTVERCG